MLDIVPLYNSFQQDTLSGRYIFPLPCSLLIGVNVCRIMDCPQALFVLCLDDHGGYGNSVRDHCESKCAKGGGISPQSSQQITHKKKEITGNRCQTTTPSRLDILRASHTVVVDKKMNQRRELHSRQSSVHKQKALQSYARFQGMGRLVRGLSHRKTTLLKSFTPNLHQANHSPATRVGQCQNQYENCNIDTHKKGNPLIVL